MSMELFPTFEGFAVAFSRTPTFATTILRTASGKEFRASWRPDPIYDYSATFNFLRQDLSDTARDEALRLVSFFERHRGSFDSFLFDDPYDGVRRRTRFVNDKLDGFERFLMQTALYPNAAWKGRIALTTLL